MSSFSLGSSYHRRGMAVEADAPGKRTRSRDARPGGRAPRLDRLAKRSAARQCSLRSGGAEVGGERIDHLVGHRTGLGPLRRRDLVHEDREREQVAAVHPDVAGER